MSQWATQCIQNTRRATNYDKQGKNRDIVEAGISKRHLLKDRHRTCGRGSLGKKSSIHPFYSTKISKTISQFKPLKICYFTAQYK